MRGLFCYFFSMFKNGVVMLMCLLSSIFSTKRDFRKSAFVVLITKFMLTNSLVSLNLSFDPKRLN